jgi:hypothetical protein
MELDSLVQERGAVENGTRADSECCLARPQRRSHMTAVTGENELFLALGRAASNLWSDLPQELQLRLFEEAVSLQGEAIRQPLAVFLHKRHARTTDGLKAQALQEPDSLGG